jgi:hypothetical protein
VDVPNAKQGDIAPKVSTFHTLHYSSLAVAECIALLTQSICLSYAQSEMDENVGSESHFLIANANGKTMTTGKRIQARCASFQNRLALCWFDFLLASLYFILVSSL